MQMSKEHCGPVKEMQLFHGTKKSVVDAICRSNFDWRLSGTNGTMYGQGQKRLLFSVRLLWKQPW